MLQLYEVGGADDAFRPSPYCWRTRMALVHKGLPFNAVPWRAVEKDRIEKSGGGTVPVLVDGETWLRESWDIAVYLETTYPDQPPLFDSVGDRTKARLIDLWVTQTVHPIIARAVLLDQFPFLDGRDKAYYLERTKRKFGKTLAELDNDPDGAIVELTDVLRPLQDVLKQCDFLGGERPSYGDYIVFGAFQWARVASSRRLLAEGSALAGWFQTLLAAHGGFAAAQPAHDHWV